MKAAGRKQKGSRVEREIAKKLTDAGIPSRRVVMSGAAARYDVRLKGDVDIGLLPTGDSLLTAEVKARRDGAGFKVLEGWLGDNQVLILRKNNTDPFVAMRWEVFVDLLRSRYEEELNEQVVRSILTPGISQIKEAK